MMLPGGRYACARVLACRRLPFFEGYSLGQICHIVQLSISQKKILGYLEGQLVPFWASEEWVKERCAEHKQPVSFRWPAAADRLPLASWDDIRRCLRDMLSSDVGPEQGIISLSNVKRLFRMRFNLEFSETVLGFSRVYDLLQDPRLADVCCVQTQGNGQIVVRKSDGLRPLHPCPVGLLKRAEGEEEQQPPQPQPSGSPGGSPSGSPGGSPAPLRCLSTVPNQRAASSADSAVGLAAAGSAGGLSAGASPLPPRDVQSAGGLSAGTSPLPLLDMQSVLGRGAAAGPTTLPAQPLQVLSPWSLRQPCGIWRAAGATPGAGEGADLLSPGASPRTSLAASPWATGLQQPGGFGAALEAALNDNADPGSCASSSTDGTTHGSHDDSSTIATEKDEPDMGGSLLLQHSPAFSGTDSAQGEESGSADLPPAANHNEALGTGVFQPSPSGRGRSIKNTFIDIDIEAHYGHAEAGARGSSRRCLSEPKDLGAEERWDEGAYGPAPVGTPPLSGPVIGWLQG